MSIDAETINLMDLDLYGEDRELDAFDRLRATRPVHWNAPSEHGPGFWALTRYDDVRDAASDNVRLSSAAGTQIVDRKVEGGHRSSLHNMDDPEHAKLRRIVIPQLRPVKIKQWQDAIEDSVSALVDEAQDRGTFDMVDVISARLPMLVLARVMGVPGADAPKMVDWTNRLTSSDPDHSVDERDLVHARQDVLDYFTALADQRRKFAETDLVSVLVHGRKDGEPLTEDELAAYYIVLVAAGNETTRQLLTGGALYLHDNPGSWDQIVADEALLDPAVEEMLRVTSSVAAMRRTAAVDLTIRDQQIKAGDKVVLFFSAANHDPEAFEAPREFRISRDPNDHLAFGWGVHFCLGAHLARAEGRAFFAELRRRRLRLEVTGPATRMRFNIFRAWTSMPVSLQPLGS